MKLVTHKKLKGGRLMPWAKGTVVTGAIPGLFTPEDTTGVDASLAIAVFDVGAVAHEPAVANKVAELIKCWNGITRRQSNDLFAATDIIWIGADHHRANLLFAERGKSCLDLLIVCWHGRSRSAGRLHCPPPATPSPELRRFDLRN